MSLGVNDMENLCVIGIETTGLDVLTDEVVEIGIVKVAKGETIIGRFSSLVWPSETVLSRPETARALRLQKREMSDFMHAPKSADVAKVVLAFLGSWKNTQIASYNLRFEREFLRHNGWERIGNGYPWSVCLIERCAHIMGLAGSPYCPWDANHQSYKWPRLIQAAEFFGIQIDHRLKHTALHKAEVAANIYLKMVTYEQA